MNKEHHHKEKYSENRENIKENNEQKVKEKKEEHIEQIKKEESESAEKQVKDGKKEQDKEALIKELTDKYLRALAEYDNFKKRVAKEKEDFVKFTKIDTILEFLPVFDNMERAMKSIKNTDDINLIKQGLEMILKQFSDSLTRIGVKEVETMGKFNTDFHHVLAKEVRQDKEDGEILEVYQKGYMYQDKLLRPALVKIASKEEKKEEQKSDIDKKDEIKDVQVEK